MAASSQAAEAASSCQCESMCGSLLIDSDSLNLRTYFSLLGCQIFELKILASGFETIYAGPYQSLRVIDSQSSRSNIIYQRVPSFRDLRDWTSGSEREDTRTVGTKSFTIYII